ncbi:MAG: phosphoribosylformylglycinamidine cyclo-ligase, partial [Actinobacteria bacterium]
GEMAEHPGTMAADDYDLSGFCVGVVDRPAMVTGERVAPGHVVLGLPSSGLHSNGYSLVRRAVVEGHEAELELERLDLGGITLGDALLAPTRIYVKPVLELLRSGAAVDAMAHITGGGITENLDRVLPSGCDAVIARGSWPVPPVISAVVDAAGLSDDEAHKTFNMGIGFMFVVAAQEAPAIAAKLVAMGERVFEIGEIVEGEGKVVYR